MQNKVFGPFLYNKISVEKCVQYGEKLKWGKLQISNDIITNCMFHLLQLSTLSCLPIRFNTARRYFIFACSGQQFNSIQFNIFSQLLTGVATILSRSPLNWDLELFAWCHLQADQNWIGHQHVSDSTGWLGVCDWRAKCELTPRINPSRAA